MTNFERLKQAMTMPRGSSWNPQTNGVTYPRSTGVQLPKPTGVKLPPSVAPAAPAAAATPAPKSPTPIVPSFKPTPNPTPPKAAAVAPQPGVPVPAQVPPKIPPAVPLHPQQRHHASTVKAGMSNAELLERAGLFVSVVKSAGSAAPSQSLMPALAGALALPLGTGLVRSLMETEGDRQKQRSRFDRLRRGVTFGTLTPMGALFGAGLGEVGGKAVGGIADSITDGTRGQGLGGNLGKIIGLAAGGEAGAATARQILGKD
jgi:hypothetical protein